MGPVMYDISILHYAFQMGFTLLSIMKYASNTIQVSEPGLNVKISTDSVKLQAWQPFLLFVCFCLVTKEEGGHVQWPA